VLGGEPRLLLPNASSLSWIDGGKRLLFSEIRQGLHMVLVTTDEGRGGSRDVYLPPGDRSMVHHSYLSPDGRWVLVVEMNNRGDLGPCLVVPFQGAGEKRVIGPADGACYAGAWSTDGKWIYLSILKDDYHIWRQRFPDGKPEQVTFGPTSQVGVAMSPDGKSFITSVGTRDYTVWLHDRDQERQISTEGRAGGALLSGDGNKLYFEVQKGPSLGQRLWVKDLATGSMDEVLPGYDIDYYSVSRDGKLIAFTQIGQHGIWIDSASRRSSPRLLHQAGDSPYFVAGDSLVFRVAEGGSNFIYRISPDGSGLRQMRPEPILDLLSVSPDIRWAIAATAGTDPDQSVLVKALALDGPGAVLLSPEYAAAAWDVTGKFLYFYPGHISTQAYALPVLDNGLPKVPPGGFSRIEDFALAGAGRPISAQVDSAFGASTYAYTRKNVLRNLYRIPLR
jgi:hypothetical protein